MDWNTPDINVLGIASMINLPGPAVCSESQLYKQAGNAVIVNAAYTVVMMLPESRSAAGDEEKTRWENAVFP